jgi:2-haloacid dehalogenase
VLGAEVARAYKPQPAVYLQATELLCLAPKACMMVAAHNSDLLAARDCGLRTAFVVRPREHGPEQRSDLVPTDSYDLIAADFIDLATQLGCPK